MTPFMARVSRPLVDDVLTGEPGAESIEPHSSDQVQRGDGALAAAPCGQEPGDASLRRTIVSTLACLLVIGRWGMNLLISLSAMWLDAAAPADSWLSAAPGTRLFRLSVSLPVLSPISSARVTISACFGVTSRVTVLPRIGLSGGASVT